MVNELNAFNYTFTTNRIVFLICKTYAKSVVANVNGFCHERNSTFFDIILSLLQTQFFFPKCIVLLSELIDIWRISLTFLDSVFFLFNSERNFRFENVKRELRNASGLFALYIYVICLCTEANNCAVLHEPRAMSYLVNSWFIAVSDTIFETDCIFTFCVE